MYGEQNVTIRYRAVQVLWKLVGRLVQVLAVDHPRRGRILLLCTDLDLPPLEVIRIYSRRFKIEVSFKQAVHKVGAFSYHFWMRDMERLHHGDGNQYLHRRFRTHREQVMRKLAANERHILLGLIAQGFLQYLALSKPVEVLEHFGSWLAHHENRCHALGGGGGFRPAAFPAGLSPEFAIHALPEEIPPYILAPIIQALFTGLADAA